MLRGETAEHVKPFKGVGSGVMEIAERYATNAYRLVYAVQLGNSLYRAARVPEQIQVRHCDAANGRRFNREALQRGAGESEK